MGFSVSASAGKAHLEGKVSNSSGAAVFFLFCFLTVPHLTRTVLQRVEIMSQHFIKKTTTISHFIFQPGHFCQTLTKLKKERKKFVEQPNPVLVVCRNAFFSSAKINMRLEKL